MLTFPERGTHMVGFAGSNGHPYVSIGKLLVEEGQLRHRRRVDAGIRHLARRPSPGRRRACLNANPRFVFFRTLDGPGRRQPGRAGHGRTHDRDRSRDLSARRPRLGEGAADGRAGGGGRGRGLGALDAQSRSSGTPFGARAASTCSSAPAPRRRRPPAARARTASCISVRRAEPSSAPPPAESERAARSHRPPDVVLRARALAARWGPVERTAGSCDNPRTPRFPWPIPSS